jgi:hypothetical protein
VIYMLMVSSMVYVLDQPLMKGELNSVMVTSLAQTVTEERDILSLSD